jgi:hypothetical protein
VTVHTDQRLPSHAVQAKQDRCPGAVSHRSGSTNWQPGGRPGWCAWCTPSPAYPISLTHCAGWVQPGAGHVGDLKVGDLVWFLTPAGKRVLGVIFGQQAGWSKFDGVVADALKPVWRYFPKVGDLTPATPEELAAHQLGNRLVAL